MPGFFGRDAVSKKRSVLIGAAVLCSNGQYENVIIQLDGEKDQVVYRQRMPVPVSMWIPWGGNTRAFWLDNPYFETRGLKIAPLICYEQYLIWPVLQSMFYRPDVLIALGNLWWCKNTSLPAIQKQSVLAWARLFDVDLVTSYNF